MGTNRRYGSPRDRAAGRARQAAIDALTPVMPRIRHVWVRPTAGADVAPSAGLIISWERGLGTLETSGRSALVAFTSDEAGGLTLGWLLVELLSPATPSE